MAKKESKDLSKADKVLILGLTHTMLKKESKNKALPFRLRRNLKKMAKEVKNQPTLLLESRDTFEQLLEMTLKVSFTGSHGNTELTDRVFDLFAPSDESKELYQECKKKALTAIKNELEEE